ncbi:hypothetical protein ACFOWE_00115 [Planomonospora corallina]|uniref:Uncharacterized protein n=1 Tax=Planomonospora corallina TaxID=1806052 RepID=A0ABV8I437_9ACTN
MLARDGACNPDSDGNDCSPAETISPPRLEAPAWTGACNPDSDGNDCSPAETISPPVLLPATTSHRATLAAQAAGADS